MKKIDKTMSGQYRSVYLPKHFQKFNTFPFSKLKELGFVVDSISFYIEREEKNSWLVDKEMGWTVKRVMKGSNTGNAAIRKSSRWRKADTLKNGNGKDFMRKVKHIKTVYTQNNGWGHAIKSFVLREKGSDSILRFVYENGMKKHPDRFVLESINKKDFWNYDFEKEILPLVNNLSGECDPCVLQFSERQGSTRKCLGLVA